MQNKSRIYIDLIIIKCYFRNNKRCNVSRSRKYLQKSYCESTIREGGGTITSVEVFIEERRTK